MTLHRLTHTPPPASDDDYVDDDDDGGGGGDYAGGNDAVVYDRAKSSFVVVSRMSSGSYTDVVVDCRSSLPLRIRVRAAAASRDYSAASPTTATGVKLRRSALRRSATTRTVLVPDFLR